MKRHVKNYACFTLAASALAAFCGSVRADISTVVTSTTLAWPSGPNPIFYSATPLSGLSSQGPPGAATGAAAESLSETFTLTNSAGVGAGGPGPGSGSNYVLTGIGLVIGGYDSSTNCTVHIYDVTTNLVSNNGSKLNGSGASYNNATPSPEGDLLGEGAGLPFINAAHSGAEQVIYLGLQNGPTTYGDQVVLAASHTYAVEVSVPTGSGAFTWYRNSTADSGGQGMGSTSAPNPGATRLTLTSLGLAGGAPRTFALALYGTATTNLTPSGNGSTNIVGKTNIWIDQFNASMVTNASALIGGLQLSNMYEGTNDYSLGYIGNIWANWFGSSLQTLTWDPTTDAQGNTNSGSLKIVASFDPVNNTQFEIWDQGPGNTIGNPFGANGLNAIALDITNFQCDVLFTNGDAATTNAVVNNDVGFYGFFQFGSRSSTYGQAYWPGGATVSVGNTNWVHVSLPLNPSSLPSGTGIFDTLLHMDGPYYTPPLNGNSTIWVDNIKFTAPPASAIVPPAPPKLSVSLATPALRIFAGSAVNTYDREELSSVDQSQSWVDGSYPVSYSFTLSHAAKANAFQTHIFLVPINTLPSGNNVYGNEYVEYQASNNLWLQINGTASNTVTANVSWKTNDPNANPNIVALNITNSTAVGTWTLTFTSASTGTLTAPGASPAAFTIADTNVANDFGDPVVAYFGVQPNSTGGEGLYDDYIQIETTNVAGGSGSDLYDNFTMDTSINLGLWETNNSAAAYSLVLVTTNTPLWVSWTVPAIGYGLGVSPTLVGTYEYPGDYNGDYDDPPTADMGGVKWWSLIPSDCLPSYVNPAEQDAFFILENPAPN
jgi:hypothetical protein